MAGPSTGQGPLTSADIEGEGPQPGELDDLLGLAIELAHDAATHHTERRLGTVDAKSTPTDPVTDVDRASELAIVAGLEALRPDDAIVGEEGTGRDGSSGFRWVIDPLDGTVNYVHGLPCHAVAIGVEWNGTPVVGVVYDTGSGELFTARRGGGARCNGAALQASETDQLPTALMGTGFPYAPDQRTHHARVITELIGRIADIRRSGSCAIDMCWTAAGRLDAYYETGPMPWDVTAGLVIVAEAGGIAHYDPERRRIMASGPALWGPLCELVEHAERRAGRT